ncbi:hypothetical protein NF212_11005 [Parasalinivibrio latis]|uniref:hypothetical protein n=1 Tax=Parasalinivibrio latis TaxID=2952610 RepID=UPI0030E052C9
MSNEDRPIEPACRGGFFQALTKLLLALVAIAVFLWNFDGFWQTDVHPLVTFQKQYFPVKFKEEKLKVSNVYYNNELIDEIQERLVEERQQERNLASKLTKTKQQLEYFKTLEDQKCEYYQTSLQMLRQLKRKYSEDELNDVLRCTNQECIDIRDNNPASVSFCS